LRGGVERMWFDQVRLRKFLRDERADALFSTANFAILGSPCPQLLLVRNALYFSEVYRRHILSTKPLRVRAGEEVRPAPTILSSRAADVVMTPSGALRDEMASFLGAHASKVVVNPYGVDATRFASVAKVERGEAPARLLFTSLYAEHKNL